MKLTGLHILLTYKCVYECDHCFVWGSPRQNGVFTLEQLDDVLQQARALGTIRELYFEGGETFVYYPVLIEAVRRATSYSFVTAVVTNGYWATSLDKARTWLRRLAAAGLRRIEISIDDLHGDQAPAAEHPGLIAACELGLDTAVLSVTAPCCDNQVDQRGNVMFRGRAAKKLTAGLERQPWASFTACPYENLAAPGRVHLDPFGYLHLCQGLVIGNLFECSLSELVATYEPERHPIVGPLLAGGPAELVRRYQLDHEWGYVDGCHLCYQSREVLRARFPTLLGPDQMYGVS